MAEATAKVEGLSQNTKVTLPLYLQIVILLSVITFTATAVMGYAKLISNDSTHETKLSELQDKKLDKTTYEKDKDLNDYKYQEVVKKLEEILQELKKRK